MRALRSLPLLLALVAAGCYRGSEAVDGPFACTTARDCGAGLVCDDGLCCRLGGTPACPTRAHQGRCANGASPQTLYLDEDRDGHGDPAQPVEVCATPTTSFVSALADDCEDDPLQGGALTYPGAPEQCDGRDNDCDGKVDFEFFRDEDGDGYGDPAAAVLTCLRPAGYVDNADDCAPDAFARNPGAAEVCNKLDDDCDEAIDEGIATTSWYQDNDGDGFGAGAATVSCYQPPGYRSTSNDCDDANPGRFPGNFERCDGVPNDCDASTDERPDCGGQVNLLAINTPVTYGAQETGVLAAGLNDFQHCYKDYDPSLAVFSTETFAPPGWGAFGGTAHVMWVESARGWDLTKAGATLNFEGRANWGGQVTPVWTQYNQPIVILCDRNNRWRRFRPTTRIPDGGAPSWIASIPIAGSGGSIEQFIGGVANPATPGSWVMFQDPAFDAANVVRVEILLQMTDIEGDGFSPYFNATVTKLGF